MSQQETSHRRDVFPEMTDEFDGQALDASKWLNPDPGWQGRHPAFFAAHNVAVRDGGLELTARAEDLPDLPPQYHTYTTASVLSRAMVRYGYFEIKARAMRSRASSAFWFYHGDKVAWTEIDVFEIGAGSPGKESKVFMNAHVMHSPTVKEPRQHNAVFDASSPVAEHYHVYALDWDRERIRWFVDGVQAHEVENVHWHYPLNMAFDSETFEHWFGLPDPAELPATFRIEYVHSWRYPDLDH